MPKQKTCPKGFILRNAYQRKGYRRADGTYVKSAYIPAAYTPDRGAPGKAPLSRRVLPPVKNEYMLRNFGYSVYHTPKRRRIAIDKAVRKYKSSLYVERHLILIKNYTPHNEPAHKMLVEDVKYLRSLRPATKSLNISKNKKNQGSK